MGFLFKQKASYALRISDGSSDFALPIWGTRRAPGTRRRPPARRASPRRVGPSRCCARTTRGPPPPPRRRRSRDQAPQVGGVADVLEAVLDSGMDKAGQANEEHHQVPVDVHSCLLVRLVPWERKSTRL